MKSFSKKHKITHDLNREHIEFVLGVRMPLIIESIDNQLIEQILNEQIIFENMMSDLTSGARTFVKGRMKRILNLPSNLADLKNFLGLVFKNPKWLTELSGHLEELVENINSHLASYFKAIRQVGSKTKSNIYKIAEKAIVSFENFINKFKSLGGWAKVALGVGIVSIGTFLYNKMKEVVPDLTELFKISARGAAIVGVDKPGSVSGTEIASGSLTSVVFENLLNILVQTIGPKVVSSLGSLLTGGLSQAFELISSIIGGINNLINPIKSALTATIFFANNDTEGSQGLYTNESGIKLFDLLFLR